MPAKTAGLTIRPRPRLLAAAGYTIEDGQLTKGCTAIPIELTFSDTPRNRTRYEWLAAKWKEDPGRGRQAQPG